MIVFGSRMYGRKHLVKGWGYCEACATYGKHISYTGRKWGHLYFIPLIPLGSRMRVMKQCKSCSNGVHIPEKDVPTTLNELRQRTDRALAALIAGQKEFDDNGTMMPCSASLVGAIELLYCMSAQDYVRLVLAALEEKGLTYTYHLVRGEAVEFEGKPGEAAGAYKLAADCEPTETLPLMALGAVHLNGGDLEDARAVYEKALELSDDKFGVLRVLLKVYGALKDHAKLAETYEACFTLVPELAQDKKSVKAYKKACKKAGKQPALK